MAITVFAIRALPLTLIRNKIENKYIQSFLYYVPYVTLAVMTFPAIIDSTISPVAGIVSLIAGIYFAYKEKGLFFVTSIVCLTVLIVEMFV